MYNITYSVHLIPNLIMILICPYLLGIEGQKLLNRNSSAVG